MLPDTVDPHMVDQLQAAIQRMGGQIQPDDSQDPNAPGAPGDPAGAGPPPGGPGAPVPPPGAPTPGIPGVPQALSPDGQMGPVPDGMQQAPPMDAGSSNIKRPGSLRRPQPKGK